MPHKSKLKLYNTLTKTVEDFIPIEEGKVKMYSCGPTVYDYIHLGNARTFVFSDLVRRYLQYKGYQVTMVQNITDVEDKIIEKAKQLNLSPSDVAGRYTQAYFEDADGLGIKRADIIPKATEHINEMIELIKKLIQKSHAYEVNGDVYFSVKSFKDYAKLSGREIEEQLAGARVNLDEDKADPADFALWKKAKPGEPDWDSPWGGGRPGWHLECSAMSMKYLGESFDLHCGGSDLIFPHHENEIAQSEAATGKPFAKYWLHGGFLRVNGERMGKSVGNFITVREALKSYKPEAIRLYLLSSYYRKPLDYNEMSLIEASNASRRLHNCLSTLDRISQNDKLVEIHTDQLSEPDRDLLHTINAAKEKFHSAMDSDFNTAEAIGAIFELVTKVNSFISESQHPGSLNSGALFYYARSTFLELGGVLGIIQEDKSDPMAEGIVNKLMELIMSIRQDARARKDWTTADKIRNQLKESNIIIEDTKEGTIWKYGE